MSRPLITSLKGTLKVDRTDFHLSYLPFIKEHALSRDFTHNKAGILSTSDHVYATLRSNFNRVSNIPLRNSNDSLLSSKQSIFDDKYSRKTDYYSILTLKSENNYLKSYVSELEDNFQRVFKFNEEMVKVNKKLQTKFNFYEDKIKYFVTYYYQVIESVTSIFKKTEDYLLNSHKIIQGHSIGKGISPTSVELEKLVRQKLNFLFLNEMMELKSTFENLNKHITELSGHKIDIENLSTYDHSTKDPLSMPLQEPRPTAPTRLEDSKENGRLSANIGRSTVTEGKEPPRVSFKLLETSHARKVQNTPLSQRSNRTTPNTLREIKTFRLGTLEKDSFESSSSFYYKPHRKDDSIVSLLATDSSRKNATPSKPTLKKRIEDLIKPSINLNHTRHSSLSYQTSMCQHGASTICSSTKASNQSNLISPGSNSIVIDFSKDKNLAEMKTRETEYDSIKTLNTNPPESDRKLPARKTSEVKQRPTQEMKKSTSSSRLRVNEILNNKGNTSQSFHIPSLNIKKMVVSKIDRLAENTDKNKIFEVREKSQENAPRSSSRETYDHLKTFRKNVRDFQGDLSNMNMTERGENKSLKNSRNPSSSRYRINLSYK